MALPRLAQGHGPAPEKPAPCGGNPFEKLGNTWADSEADSAVSSAHLQKVFMSLQCSV